MTLLFVVPEWIKDAGGILGIGAIVYLMADKFILSKRQRLENSQEKTKLGQSNIALIKDAMDLDQLMRNVQNKVTAELSLKYDQEILDLKVLITDRELAHMKEVRAYEKRIAELIEKHQQEKDELFQKIETMNEQLQELITKQ